MEDLGSHVARESLGVTCEELGGLENQALSVDLRDVQPTGGSDARERTLSGEATKPSMSFEVAPIETERKRKKRKRPKDEIDDLFAALL